MAQQASVTQGFGYTFPAGSTLPVGTYGVIARQPASYPGCVDGSLNCFGPFSSNGLSNGGEDVEISDADGFPMDYVDYDDNNAWDVQSREADGSCASLSLKGLDLNADRNRPAAWWSSCEMGGTPGAANGDLTCGSDLVITEIMYNPCDAQGNNNNYEFVELYNNGAAALDVGEAEFVQGFGYKFPAGASIAPDEYVIVARNPESFADLTAAGKQVFGPFDTGSLSNGGEDIGIVDRAGILLDHVDYDDNNQWDTNAETADGGCASLELYDTSVDNSGSENNDVHLHWYSSCTDHGTPAAPNDVDTCLSATLVINEIGYNPCAAQGAGYQFVELVNIGTGTADLSGATFTQGLTYEFPAGTSIAPEEFLIVAVEPALFVDGVDVPAGAQVLGPATALDTTAGTVELKDSAGNLVDNVDYTGENTQATQANGGCSTYELAAPGLDNSVGVREHWYSSCKAGGTPAAANDVDSCGGDATGIVITEINYNPCNPPGPENFPDDDWEFVEVYNAGTEEQPLGGATFTKGIEFTFPGGSTLAPSEYAIVARKPVTFDGLTNAAGAAVQVFGPFGDSLSNGGEDIELTAAGGTLLDYVDYDDNNQWDVQAAMADGACSTLELANPNWDNSGNETASAHANWFSSCQLGGTPGDANEGDQCLASSIVITEIMYNPCADQGTPNDFEFVELFNNGASEVDLTGAYFTQGFGYAFPAGSVIAAQEYVIVARKPESFQALIDAGKQVFGPFTNGGLSNGGEDVGIVDAAGLIVDYVDYDDNNQWDVNSAMADGGCSSLELYDATGKIAMLFRFVPR